MFFFPFAVFLFHTHTLHILHLLSIAFVSRESYGGAQFRFSLYTIYYIYTYVWLVLLFLFHSIFFFSPVAWQMIGFFAFISSSSLIVPPHAWQTEKILVLAQWLELRRLRDKMQTAFRHNIFYLYQKNKNKKKRFESERFSCVHSFFLIEFGKDATRLRTAGKSE